MKFLSVVLVLDFCRFLLVFKVAELLFVELTLGRGLKPLIGGRDETFASYELFIDCAAGFFRKGLAKDIFRLYLGDVASIARYVLSFDVGGGTTEPVFSLLRIIAERNRLAFKVLGRRVRVEFSGRKLRLALRHLHIVVGRLVARVSNDAVNVASRAPVDVILAGNETSVAGQVLLVVRTFFRHFCFGYN